MERTNAVSTAGNIKEQLRGARPTLRRVAPLTWAICWGYALTNLLLGVGFYSLYEPTVPIAVANVFSYQVWGFIFGGMGLLKIVGLVRNNWRGVRHLLLIGLLVKSIWAIALIFRCFSEPKTTIAITIIWLFFAYIQAVTYVYFIPPTEAEANHDR